MHLMQNQIIDASGGWKAARLWRVDMPAGTYVLVRAIDNVTACQAVGVRFRPDIVRDVPVN